MGTDTTTLAGLDRPIAPLGLGTWAWGDRATWGMGGYDADLTEERWEAREGSPVAAGGKPGQG